MAGALLMEISKNERERARYRSRRMFETDQTSNILTAETRGENRAKLEIARNLKSRGVPTKDIVDITGLTFSEVENA